MFFKLSALAVFVPLASALSITTPTNWTSGGPAVISWTTTAGDPDTWSFELVNAVFNNAFAIANNVNPSSSPLSLTLPSVPPGDGYTLQAVNISDINTVFTQTGDFAIGATISTSESSSSTASVSSTLVSGSASTLATTHSTTPFGVTVSSSSTGAASTGAAQAGSGTSSSPSTTPSSFNGSGNGNGNGAVSNGIASWVSMMFAAVAGAVAAL